MPSLLDSEPASVIDRQVRQHHGATTSLRGNAPWVDLQQRIEMRLRRQALKAATTTSELDHPADIDRHRAATADDDPPARVALCVAGAARTFVHPAVGWSVERFVRGAAGLRAQVDVFVALGTGEEDHRARTNYLPLDEQVYVRSPEGAAHLAAALARLRPRAVRSFPGLATATCRTPPTGQFEKIAACVDLATAHEQSALPPGSRYDLLVRIRPDVVWTMPILSHGVSLASLARSLNSTPALQRTVLGADDIALLAPRSAWAGLASLRPSALTCHRLCHDAPYWRWMHGLRTHCLLKAQLAAKNLHHVELLGAAPHVDVLHARTLPPHAPPLLAAWSGAAWGSGAAAADGGGTVDGGAAARPPPSWLPADQLRLGAFEIWRARAPDLRASVVAASSEQLVFGLAVTCAAAVDVADPCAAGVDAEQADEPSTSRATAAVASGDAAAAAAAAGAPWRCELCTTPRWLGRSSLTAHVGFCGKTVGEGDCAKGHKGAYEMGGAGEATGVVGAAACMRKCEACARCQYISFSPHHEDCSYCLHRLQPAHPWTPTCPPLGACER